MAQEMLISLAPLNSAASYTRFERDQVLTEKDLNDAVEYLDHQGRGTRVYLVGVGILSGLRATLVSDRVRLTRGVGVTTDGDLLVVPDAREYRAFRAYDDTAPRYAPLIGGEARVPAWELLADAGGDPLTEFKARTNRELERMTAVLLCESVVKDPDLCTGTDCDNRGGQVQHTQRLLLIDKASAAALRERIETPDSAARRLEILAAERPALSGVGTASDLRNSYAAACKIIQSKLTDALQRFYGACGAFIADLFPTDPGPGWIAALNAIYDRQLGGTGIQYLYDFLKDLIETYGDIRDHLSGDTSVCAPDLGAFPKHLLLGDLVAPAGSETNRTGFYPAAQLGAPGQPLARARSLVQRLAAQVAAFGLPSDPAQGIKITPSLGEDHPLSERAIPCYYQSRAELPIHEHWSYTRTRAGLAASHYSYNAAQYNAQGAASNPLAYHIGRFPFFRVEGHLGMQATTALSILRAEITRRGLPFTALAVLLDSDVVWVLPQPIQYGDLHSVHNAIRAALAEQLEVAANFGQGLKERVLRATREPTLVERPEDIAPITQATDQADVVASSAAAASKALRQTYSAATADTTWRSEAVRAMTAAGTFKADINLVAKTEASNPFDTLIGTAHLALLDFLKEQIDAKQKRASDDRLFAAFRAQHPGLEHSAGVCRGGTFVLGHNADGVVVADFMLPYRLEEAPVKEPLPSQLPLPSPSPGRLDWTVLGPKTISLKKPVERLVSDKVDRAVVNQRDFFQQVLGVAGTLPSKFVQPTPRPQDLVSDPVLAAHLDGMRARTNVVSLLREWLLDPTRSPEDRKEIEKQLDSAEDALAAAALATAGYVKAAKLEVKAGSSGLLAISAVADSTTKLSRGPARDTVRTGLTALAGDRTDLGVAFGSIINRIAVPIR